MILIAALTLLGYVEALHYSNVSVEKWDMTSYQERYTFIFFMQLIIDSVEYCYIICEKKFLLSSLYPAVYACRYPRSCRVQKLVNTNEKVQRFLVGRQFFVIFVVFIISQCTTLPYLPANYLGMPAGLVKGLFGSGERIHYYTNNSVNNRLFSDNCIYYFICD